MVFLLPTYLLLLLKSFQYLLRDGKEDNNCYEARVLTSLIIALMFNEKFPENVLSELKKSIKTLYTYKEKTDALTYGISRVEFDKQNTHRGKVDFYILKNIAENISIGDVKRELERKKNSFCSVKRLKKTF